MPMAAARQRFGGHRHFEVHSGIPWANAGGAAIQRHNSCHALQRAGMIKYARGNIQILDVEGLRGPLCECYETVKEQYEQLMTS